ncbi:MAG: hypothetical protein O7D33_00470 [Chloroflexi bacterium]|nr:hypothetical protein [Chloroflexota bacterium]
MSTQNSPLDARRTLESASGPVTYHSLPRLQETGAVRLDSLPFSIRIVGSEDACPFKDPKIR